MKYSRKKARIKIIHNILIVFQYPHLIDVTTGINFVTV